MQQLLTVLALFASLSSCGQSAGNKPTEAQMDCGPDAPVECSFINLPETVSNIMNIPVDEGVAAMTITGRILKADGVTPYAGVLLYAYHTDAEGKYSRKGNERGVHRWHGRHHGWVKTDENGKYTINSIRPAQYPGNQFAAHIHATLKEPGKKPYWINDFVFKDDPLVTEEYRRSQRNAGGDGVVDVKLVDGRWEGVRNIILRD